MPFLLDYRGRASAGMNPVLQPSGHRAPELEGAVYGAAATGEPSALLREMTGQQKTDGDDRKTVIRHVCRRILSKKLIAWQNAGLASGICCVSPSQAELQPPAGPLPVSCCSIELRLRDGGRRGFSVTPGNQSCTLL